MKSKHWAAVLAGVFALCTGLSLWFFREKPPAAQAEIWSDGVLICTLPLSRPQQIRVESREGTNVVTVADGKIAVTDADCPDGNCTHRGFCDSGAPIVCLPNRLLIRFTGGLDVDAVSG